MIEHWRAFDRAWFARHQRVLLAGLRFDALRWALAIDDDGDIVQLLPHAYIVRERDCFRFVGRTHAKYAKRMYHAFAPLWWAMHGWDWAIADRLAPRLSFGFDTLTAYPQTGSGGTTCDGVAARSVASETFATIIAGAGTSAGTGSTAEFCGLIASGTTNQYTYLGQIFCSFDTSAITDGADVSAANFGIEPNASPQTGLGTDTAHVVESLAAAANNLASTDYRQAGTTSFGSSSIANFGTGAYEVIALNGSGLAAISKTGVTELALRTGWDKDDTFGGSWAAFLAAGTEVKLADTTGTASDPYLEVTYALPPSVGYLRPNRIRPAPFAPGNAR